MEQLTKEELAFLYDAYKKNQDSRFVKIKQKRKIKLIYIFYAFIVVMVGWLLLFL